MKLTTAVLGATLALGLGATTAVAAQPASSCPGDVKTANALRSAPSKGTAPGLRVVTLPAPAAAFRGAVWLPKVTR